MARPRDDEPTKSGKDATKKVVEHITEVMKDHDYEPSAALEKEMPLRYEPGFIEAHRREKDFFKKRRKKILRMASFAAAFSCFLAERRTNGRALAGRQYAQVDVSEWLMAMGIIRSACLDHRKEARRNSTAAVPGIPCNRENFPIDAAVKRRVVTALNEVVADLMTGDPDGRR